MLDGAGIRHWWAAAGEWLHWAGRQPRSTAILTWPSMWRTWFAACGCSASGANRSSPGWLVMGGAGVAPPLVTAEPATVNFTSSTRLNPSDYSNPEQLLS